VEYTDQEWKHDSYLYYLSPVLELVASPIEDYAKVLEVDKRVRAAYAPPRINQEGSGPGMGSNVSDTRSKPSHVAMQQAMLTSAIETGACIFPYLCASARASSAFGV
jgi:hypothetical protein